MTQTIHWTMMIPIQRLPWVEWRMRVSCCLIPPHHHLGGRMFGQTTSSRKFEVLACPIPTIVGVVIKICL